MATTDHAFVSRAPGKLVLSGAYSVLWGAPCLVAAVDRYAVAHWARPHVHLADEVATAIELGLLERACFIDVSELRAPVSPGSTETRKLGLGSSAAIVVATMAASRGALALPDGSLSKLETDRLFRDALRAHRTAQRGGSGVDVAASVYGGVLACRIDPDGALAVEQRTLPPEIQIHVFASKQPASTQGMVARVRAFESREPTRHAELIGAARSAAEDAARTDDADAFLDALRRQDVALRRLGVEAEVPIFTAELDALSRAAAAEGAFFGPSGAGGGDVGIYVGTRAPGAGFATALGPLEVEPVTLRVGARGVRTERLAST